MRILMRKLLIESFALWAAMEVCAPSQRNYVGALYTLPWSLGYMLMPLVAYMVRPWRWLTAVYAALFFITLVYIWYGYDYCVSCSVPVYL